VSGQLISRYGRWKGFLVAGASLTTAGLGLLSTMDHTTAIPLVSAYLGVLGLGVGMTMQNLVLAVQNTVDVRDVGAASSLVTFLRSMGGTVGVTVLGVVLSNRVSALLGGSSTVGTGDLSGLDAAAGVAVRAAYGDGIGLVFLIAAIGSLLTLVAVLFIKEVPLRTTVGTAPEPAGDATAAAPVAPADRGPRHAAQPAEDTATRDRLLDVLLPRPQEALAALDEAERAARDLADARGRLASSVHRLREAGFGQRQIDGLLAERTSHA
jgi:hypothetical protein